MLTAGDITLITYDKPGPTYVGPPLAAVWAELVSQLQYYGINYPNVRVAMAATVAVESMFDPGAHYYGSNLYRGRGLIQLTSEANYATFGHLIGSDLHTYPDLIYELHISARVAALFFKVHSLDTFANRGDWYSIRKKVNGTQMNGFDKFLSYIWPMLEAEYATTHS
jgi:hypothetical protein